MAGSVTSAGLDVNNAVTRGSTLAMTTETMMTLIVVGKTGTHNKHVVGVQISPNGTDWVDIKGTVRGEGCTSFPCAAASGRVFVKKAEGSASTADIYLIAR